MAKIILTESQFKRLVQEIKIDMDRIDAEAEKADKSPTIAQKEAGNISPPHFS